MKVLSITPTFLPQLGGMEQVVFELARRVRPLGVDMEVAHVAPDLDPKLESIQGVAVHRVPLKGNRVIGWSPGLKSLARNYDLLHVHDPQLLAITANVRSSCALKPAVLSTHGGFWHTNNGYLFKKTYEATLLRGSVGHYRRVLASSIGDFEYFKRYSRHIALCSNGVQVKRFSSVGSATAASPHRWIYWGRLSRNKRVDLVIDYVSFARKLHPIELLVCGRDFDQLLPELNAQVRRLELHDCVHFEPFLDDASLLTELNSRSVYITASEHEGFGLSIVEAMAAGLNVVCRDMVPLNSFIAHGKSGWLQQFDGSDRDLQLFAEFLAAPPGARAAISQAARQAAAEHDWDVVAPRFVQHYREVLAEAAQQPGRTA